MELINIKKQKQRKLKIDIDEEIEIRDLRDKFYMVDDAYMNGWAKKCGIYATGVYHALCRHVGSDQSCFPSITLISDKLHISVIQVKRAIKILEFYKIIKVQRTLGERNKYWLTDKSVWKKTGVKEFYKIGNLRPATKEERAKLNREDG